MVLKPVLFGAKLTQGRASSPATTKVLGCIADVAAARMQ
jgi:hypothetical protein